MSGPRIVYISASIGLGHVSKDLAIARELRRLRPDAEILWLAAHPASRVLREAGERMAPGADQWFCATRMAERCMKDGQLNLVRYVYRSLPHWVGNARLFRAAVTSCEADIAVGNESWEVDIPLILHALPLPVPFVLITDFVGTVVMSPNLLDQAGGYALNALWSLDACIYNGRRHSALFIGEPEDVADEPLGPGLPSRRGHALAHYEFVGHALRFDPADYADRPALRRTLGYGDEPLVVCAVGGTAIGRDLLERCGAAWPYLRERLPGARLVLVCGPRLQPADIRVPEGPEVLGYVPRLYELFACADVAVVQCGASATTELAALRTPFVYFPIEGHFEQEIVAARLQRYGLGRRMSLRAATPPALAAAVAAEYGHTPPASGMPTDGARRAAEHILRTLAGHPSRTGPGGHLT